ncbi:MAG: YggS family pyridoxal phosphate-dependent enzyme [Zetaproteobacteria bacterium CG_4_9_14_3_um_filter_49_83]|nr:MAG: YggS family pyridoxal phosphate enzyme [Zetaproteobacteria bacterium CG1_02_49_23]PIY57171.1 MAG: YggS family pyridoxal phosphate-dependent enzyme [Zetaproteobacteria bacterium CG_4_10_14_0_8_um_filter_49_80]PJA34446.1 MAG: YggS family pyridoxal phosphate-dependent enzyme [Zetaproteobacteria bacterium CG_4_9_14_3_um_filter_49_83]
MQKNYETLRDALTARHVRLIAVSKYSEDEKVSRLAALGQVDFAESRPQALRDRALLFPQLRWHMIGPLQKNKAKYIGRFAYMWHSLCDIDTARAVAGHVENRVLPVLIQVHISGEAQKQGVAPDQLADLLEQLKDVPQLEVIGLMGMASSDGEARQQFRSLCRLRDNLNDAKIRQLCMGMSGDWKIAVEEGASMVRIGRALFDSEQA